MQRGTSPYPLIRSMLVESLSARLSVRLCNVCSITTRGPTMWYRRWHSRRYSVIGQTIRWWCVYWAPTYATSAYPPLCSTRSESFWYWCHHCRQGGVVKPPTTAIYPTVSSLLSSNPRLCIIIRHSYFTARCKYIDMFPNSNTLRNEPGFDDELMGRYSQAVLD